MDGEEEDIARPKAVAHPVDPHRPCPERDVIRLGDHQVSVQPGGSHPGEDKIRHLPVPQVFQERPVRGSLARRVNPVSRVNQHSHPTSV